MADNQPTPDTADQTPEGRTPEQVSDPQEPSPSEAPTGTPTKKAAKSAEATSKALPGDKAAKATKSTKSAKTARASKSAAKANGGSAEAAEAPAKPASGPAKSASAKAAKPPTNAADPTAKTRKPKAPKATKPAKKTARETAKRPATAAESPAPPAETPVAAKPAAPSSNGRAGASAPQKPTEPSTPARASAPPPALPRRLPQPRVWFDAGWEAVRQLDQPPRDLLELAVAELGPQAEAWAGWLRETYPGAPADGMARLATQQARRHGGLLASTGALGPLAAALQLPALAATRVALVLRIAAVHGHDPADPARVADLVTLLDLDPGAGRSRVVRGLGLAFRAAGVLGRRRNPVGMAWALLSVGEQREDLERLAHRAARHYRGLTTADRPAR